LDELTKAAGLALYEAKNAGRMLQSDDHGPFMLTPVRMNTAERRPGA
jgi:hypothetical protein